MTMNPFAGRTYGQTSQTTTTTMPQSEMTLEQFMAGIRRLESGSYEGNYNAIGRMVRGDQARGAYQIMSRYWDDWAAQAGIPGANWRDPAAQDRVAAHVMQRYYDALGNWDLVALAWYAGGSTAKKVLQRGYATTEDIQTAGIRQYVEEAMGYARQSVIDGYMPKPQGYAAIPTERGNKGSQWTFPVAGESEWSRGSYMPDTLNHRNRNHAAVDVYAEAGTPIVAPTRGKVLSSSKNKLGGHTVRIEGQDGFIYYFAHMRDAAVVGAGQFVAPGQHIGFVGNSGSAATTSPHLHFSIKTSSGAEVSPVSFLESAYQVPYFDGYDQALFGNVPGGIGSLDEAKGAYKKRQTPAGYLTNMLDGLSNKVAGGTRDPSVYQNYGIDPEVSDEMGETP